MMRSSSSSSFSLDGFFFNVKEGVDDMIKFLANEPSVGLYFVQQHAQASMPYLLDVKKKVGEKVREVTLHTEDIEDSICAVRTMTEYGIPLADEMTKDINKSLLIMSTTQPKKGLIVNPRWGSQAGGSIPRLQDSFNYSITGSQQGGGTSSGYLSAVFNSAKQKASGLRWSQQAKLLEKDEPVSSKVPSSVNTSVPTSPDTESDELPLSSQLLDNRVDEGGITEGLYDRHLSSMLESFDKFKYEREAKFEEWLREAENPVRSLEAHEWLWTRCRAYSK